MMRYLTYLTLLSGLSLHATAQTVSVDQRSLIQRLDRIEHRLVALEDKVFSDAENTGGSTPVADFEIRLQEIERESSGIYGAVEQLGHGVEELARRVEVISKDMDLRLKDLEELAVRASALPDRSKIANPPAIAMPDELVIEEGIDPEEHYKKAYNYLTAAAYPTAQKWLEEFLRRNPEHELADNAYYWLGEVHLVQDDPEAAVISFKQGLDAFPQGAKAAGNLLKMGVALKRLNKTHHARSTWEKLMKDYPDSPEAKKAEQELKELNGDQG